MKEQFTVVAALLGLAEAEATQDKVSANIKELLSIKNKFDGVQSELTQVKNDFAELQTKLTGSEAAVANLTKNLDETKAALKVYQDAEAKAKEAEIEAMVEDAIKACKIEKDAKEAWVNMAKANLELAKSTLASIPARENIEANIKPSEEAPKNPVEKEIEAKVKDVLGDKFEYTQPKF